MDIMLYLPQDLQKQVINWIPTHIDSIILSLKRYIKDEMCECKRLQHITMTWKTELGIFFSMTGKDSNGIRSEWTITCIPYSEYEMYYEYNKSIWQQQKNINCLKRYIRNNELFQDNFTDYWYGNIYFISIEPEWKNYHYVI